MAKTLSYPVIVGILKQQQETVGIIDEYIQRILSDSNIKSNYHADLVMQHIFVNIRNSYQDSIFISQGLINNHPYYLSTALYHTISKSLYRINCTVHPDPVGAVS